MKLFALHLLGNAAILWLGYYWLGTSESRGVTLAWSAFLALLLVILTCWFHGATFAYFRGMKMPWRHVPLLVGAVLAILVLYFLVSKWEDWTSGFAFKVASWLTLKLRKPVKPALLTRVCSVSFWLVRWMVIPVYVLPLMSDLAAFGAKGLKSIGRKAHTASYWVIAPVLLACAFWVPLRVVGWVPHASSFGLEMASFILRFAVAYALFVGAWLLLARHSSELPKKV